jgi:hypothetical protein
MLKDRLNKRYLLDLFNDDMLLSKEHARPTSIPYLLREPYPRSPRKPVCGLAALLPRSNHRWHAGRD